MFAMPSFACMVTALEKFLKKVEIWGPRELILKRLEDPSHMAIRSDNALGPNLVGRPR